jgi:hypothetical protein
MDESSVSQKLPLKQTVRFGDVTVGLIHGRGNPVHLIDYIHKEFCAEYEQIDIFVFGHSHYALDKVLEGKIYFNPGSLTDTVFAPYRSYGILQITGKDIARRIVKIA